MIACINERRFHGKRIRDALISLAIVLFAVSGVTQQRPGQGLAQLVEANERFGRKLLFEVHAVSPERNVVVSPISVSILLAALQQSSYNPQLDEEIGGVFGWGINPRLRIPTRMLLAAFEEPGPQKRVPAGTGQPSVPEAAWITNTFLYRTPKGVKQPIAAEFMLSAQKYFGMKFVNTGSLQPTSAELGRVRKSLGPVPKVAADNDVWISSGTHLQSAWRGNTFSMSEPHPGVFTTSTGQTKRVTMVTSELSGYPYAKTEDFEAAALPSNSGYMLVVLPAPGKDVREVERLLADHPELLDTTFEHGLGDITIPYFKFVFESNFREPLQALGVKKVFEDLGQIVNIPGSHLTDVSQRIEIEVNREGISAAAETVAGMVYGGITTVPHPFHLQFNRPFLFLIREHHTNALLFLGAIMDPSQN